MSRNLIVYSLAAIVGLVIYFVLRAALGPGIITLLSLIALVVVGVVIFRNLQTNRKVAEATLQQRDEALTFTPPAGKAALYIYRNQFVGRAVGINIIIDGREAAQLKSPRFTRILLSPGNHRIAGYTGTNKKPADGEGLAFTANAGEIVVMKTAVEAQMVGSTVKFTPAATDTGRTDVRKITRMIAPDVSEI